MYYNVQMTQPVNGNQLASELNDLGLNLIGKISMRGDMIRFGDGVMDIDSSMEQTIENTIAAHVPDPMFDSTSIVNQRRAMQSMPV